MKKRILLSFVCLFAVFCCLEAQEMTESKEKVIDETACQSKPTKRYYMEIQGVQSPVNAKAFDVQLIAGKLFHTLSKVTQSDLRKFCSERQFNCVSDAMNHLSLLGWNLSQCYVNVMSGNTYTHWIIYKDVADTEELAEGLISK
jgi:hypothetical protein